MTQRIPVAAILISLIGSACADKANGYSYYLLSLSWSPQYCATDARPGDVQCRQPRTFIAHGLWPQKERGYPRNCGEGKYLDEALIQHMLPIMPSKQLIIHEWQTHGVCTRLNAESYFDTLTRAYQRTRVPREYKALDRYLSTTVAEIKTNSSLKPNMLTVQCDGQYLQEVRVCMNLSLEPLACGTDVRDRCDAQVVLRPPRRPKY